jgi:LPXTG-motif cell wall-anchored protein
VPLGAASDNFYGRGQMTIANTSQQVLTLYVPVGALFPPTTAGEQTMAGYTTNVAVTNPQVSQQLPNTSGGETFGLLPFIALLMLAVSGVLHLRRRAER